MKKISQRDIAKTLGVNVSSVSRALKGQKGVSEELRQQIERMAAENGYPTRWSCWPCRNRPTQSSPHTDCMALSAYQAITSRKLRIPDDVAIIGYMSDRVSDMPTPRISYVKQNPKEIAAKAFRLLLDQINGDDRVRRMQVFYGNNRADFSFIPGNVAPGLLFRKPDHFENYDDWPFLWGQNEGTIAGNTQYIIFGSSFKNIVGTN